MTDNVHIVHRRHGRLVEERVGHNVWLDAGRAFLASSLPFGATEKRINGMGFGIGGKKQILTATANSAPIEPAYPAGADQHATSGNEYDHLYPIAPHIDTLERPVRRSGGTTAYPGDPGDVWLFLPPPQSFDADKVGVGAIQFSTVIDTNLGDILYGPFTEMPLSEVGLFLDTASASSAYNMGHMVAYYSFDTILLSPGSVVEIRWQVRF